MAVSGASKGGKITVAPYNNFLSRLNSVASKHGVSGGFSQSAGAGTKATNSPASTVNSSLFTLHSRCSHIGSFSSNVPSAGSLIQMSHLTSVDSVITTVEGICHFNNNNSHCSFDGDDSGFFSGHGQFKYGGYCHGGW